MKFTAFFALVVFSLIFISCSATKETQSSSESNGNDIYVFDNPANVDTTEVQEAEMPAEHNEPVKTTVSDTAKTAVQFVYFVQVGAFSTRERAERFVKENQDKIKWGMEISFNPQVQLYVVRLPHFTTREEAEKIRDDVQKIDTFKDAFIVTVEK